MNKRILYIAFHFPPIQISSGLHRTLAFCRYFVEQGDDVTVLTVSEKAYSQVNQKNYSLIPKNLKILRCFARDTSRHFSFNKKYLNWMALPDRWQSWIFGGLFSGLTHIIKNRPDVIISTYPIASAHVIGYLLHKFTRVPWIADFRDPMLQESYPISRISRKLFSAIERKAAKHCKHIIFTSPGALALYKQRFPEVSDLVWQVLPNGYDETLFSRTLKSEMKTDLGRIILLHSGTIYPSERDPKPFFDAIVLLKQKNKNLSEKFKIVLRSTGHDNIFEPMLSMLDIKDIVSLEPPLDYVEALEEMLNADALLLMQASNCNYQTPAKAYEYLRAQKPILALTDPTGDTAKLVEQSNVAELAALDNTEQILEALELLITKIEHKKYNFLPLEIIETFSRTQQAKRLRELLLDL